MRIGVLGTGVAGRTIASKLIELGHEVCMGSRSAGNETAEAWAAHHRPSASIGTFEEAAAYGDTAFLVTSGAGAVAAATAAAGQLGGKLLIDVTNPLDFSTGTPSLFAAVTDSLGEQVQAALPDTHVVKALNTINCDVMVDAASVPGEHVTFVAGNDQGAKARTTALLGQFGWPAERVIDVGDITGARATEAYLLIWLKLMGAVGHARFNVEVRRG